MIDLPPPKFSPLWCYFDPAAAAAEIERLRAAANIGLSWMFDLEHMGSIVDQDALSGDIAKVTAELGSVKDGAEMTPLQIAMLLHYYSCGIPYAEHDRAHSSSEAVQRQRQQLIEFELMETDETSRSGYRVTERGVAYVKALCDTPFPIKKWVMPDKAA